MSPTTYNVSIAIGLGLTAGGAGAQWGWPIGMLAAGLLVLALTLVTLRMAGR